MLKLQTNRAWLSTHRQNAVVDGNDRRDAASKPSQAVIPPSTHASPKDPPVVQTACLPTPGARTALLKNLPSPLFETSAHCCNPARTKFCGEAPKTSEEDRRLPSPSPNSLFPWCAAPVRLSGRTRSGWGQTSYTRVSPPSRAWPPCSRCCTSRGWTPLRGLIGWSA